MGCKKCEGKGYIEDIHLRGDENCALLRQCCDIAAYSRRVQEQHTLGQDFIPESSPPPNSPLRPSGKVIPFRSPNE